MTFPIPKGFIYVKNRDNDDILINIHMIESICSIGENTCRIYTTSDVDSYFILPMSFSQIANLICDAQV